MKRRARLSSRLYPVDSTWIQRVGYVATPVAHRASLPAGSTGFLLVDIGTHVFAHAVPGYLFGLLMATRARNGSIGKFYHRMVKAYPAVDAAAAMRS